MSWNWNVFLKSLLFAFLGFLNGIAITFVYLAVDVDLSRFDGLLIVTGVLAGIIGLYAYSKKSSEIKETLMNVLINHYMGLVFILMMVFISFTIWLMLTPYDDIATNLFAEGLGILITVTLVNYLLNRKEEYIWKKVKNLIYEKLGKQIDGIYTEISNLCDTQEPSFTEDEMDDYYVYFEKKMYLNLKELKNIDKITINKMDKENLKKGNNVDLFIYRNNYLKDIILLYFKFLDPSIIKSLIIIRDALESIDMDVNIMKNQKEEEEDFYKWFRNDEEFFNHIKQSMVKIFTEIDSLHEESNLKIYF